MLSAAGVNFFALAAARTSECDMERIAISEIATCRVVVRGRLDPKWTDYFGELTFAADSTEATGGCTYLSGEVPDFSAYVGLINQLLNLGVIVQEITFRREA